MNPEITFEKLIYLLNTPITQEERSRVFEVTMKFISCCDESPVASVPAETTAKRGRKSSVADIPVAAPVSNPAVVEVQPTPTTVVNEVVPAAITVVAAPQSPAVQSAPAAAPPDETKAANDKVLAIKGLHADRTQANPQDKSVFDIFNQLKTKHGVTGNLNAMVEGKHFDLINDLHAALFPDTGI